jgi:hypothetical protein
MKTVECKVLNGLMLRNGMNAAQSDLNTAISNKTKYETDDIVLKKKGLLSCYSRIAMHRDIQSILKYFVMWHRRPKKR